MQDDSENFDDNQESLPLKIMMKNCVDIILTLTHKIVENTFYSKCTLSFTQQNMIRERHNALLCRTTYTRAPEINTK